MSVLGSSKIPPLFIRDRRNHAVSVGTPTDIALILPAAMSPVIAGGSLAAGGPPAAASSRLRRDHAPAARIAPLHSADGIERESVETPYRPPVSKKSGQQKLSRFLLPAALAGEVFSGSQGPRG
jgi:hypothetical protein